MNENEIITKILKLSPWSTRHYKKEAWDRMIKTAKLLQETSPGIVKKALEQFIRRTMWEDDSDQQWSKVFLLLRVMFLLPEAEDPSHACFFGGWVIPWRVSKIESEVNLGWPVLWEGNTPKLVSEFNGYKGPPYRGEDEYMYYLNTFPFRKFNNH